MFRKGFTLIELLVVISIISLLSSVVMASLNSAREKGRIGAGKHFAAQVEHIAGEQSIGLWDFDECTGSSTVDRSGFANTGSLIGTGAPVWSTDSPSGRGCSLSFNGSSRIQVPNSDALNPAESVTVSVWVKVSILNAYQNILSKGSCNSGFTNDSYVLCVHINSNMALFYGTYADGSTYGAIGIPVLPSDIGRWIHLTGVIDSTAQKIFGYKNGTLTASAPYTGGIMTTTAPLVIGGDGGAFNFTGSIDEAHVFAKALTASEVGKLYASSLLNHSLVLNE